MAGDDKTKCSRCGLELTGMVAFRCPRCNNLLLTPCHCDGNCTKCSASSGCDNERKGVEEGICASEKS